MGWEQHAADCRSRMSWPPNVGILAIELVFPHQYVDQAELEKYDGVSTGKYTVGLGQNRMGFCTDQEDVNSLCLTVVSKLMKKTDTDYMEIGRLEVGTETIIDKSKSVKTILMQLFAESGNSNVEGVDTTNACYGGTAALFNSVAWIESSAWDGRLALAVCADIAVYAEGNARPTGGAGAVAMLIGPNAPLIMERGLRASYMSHAYDFYKPDLTSEYPTVDGKLSIECYLSALDNCYRKYCKLASKKYQPNGASSEFIKPVNLDYFDYFLFHSPYCKLVQKSLARLTLNDFVTCDSKEKQHKFPGLEKYLNVKLENSYFDKDIEKAFLLFSKDVFEMKTKSSLFLASEIGNMYTPSLYSCLVSLLISEKLTDLAGKRIGLFSYGSGLASSIFSLQVTNDVSSQSLIDLVNNLAHIEVDLKMRDCIPPEKFSEILKRRAQNLHAAPYIPEESGLPFYPGTFYLERIDEKHRRFYKISS